MKGYEIYTQRKDSADAMETAIRQELRSEVSNLKTQVKELEGSVEKWRSMYYDLMDEISQIKSHSLLREHEEN